MADKPPLVLVDADNTLWDTDDVYAQAQTALLDEAIRQFGGRPEGDPLAFVRSVDQALAETHHDGLRYPPRYLARALRTALHGEPADRAARRALAGPGEDASIEVKLANDFIAALRRTPALREGVSAGLAHIKEAGVAVVVLTEGARKRVEATADALGVSDFIWRIFEGKKRKALFARFRRYAGAARGPHVIGDQLDRDIAPAKDAGLPTIHFPGGFRPRWTPADGVVMPDHVVDDFLTAGRIVTAGMS